MITFNIPPVIGTEEKYIKDAIANHKICGDGEYTKKCNAWLEENTGSPKALLTTSCTHATEMAALLCDIQPGDEVIMPSFTFVSTADAFVLRGAKVVFVDIRPDTMNIDETKIEDLITNKTKAIYVVDYAGVPCEMDVINDIAKRHNLHVIEDSAQAVGSTYKGRSAGTLSELGCYSFHETKNYVMGEGGAIVINDTSYLDRAEILREKGTNRRQLLKGMVDKYTWHDIGSSFLPSDILAALLYSQMERFDEIMQKRLNVWNTYHDALLPLKEEGRLDLQTVPDYVTHNGHMFNIILPSTEVRTRVAEELKKDGIYLYICYVPLHSAPMGLKLGYDPKSCPVTEEYGERVLRLPLFADMTTEDALTVTEKLKKVL
jgi:dTDP-4-amino-4,6-dideoxygalactose transaminase